MDEPRLIATISRGKRKAGVRAVSVQMTPTIDFRVLDERIRPHLPAYATPGSAGMDLRACIDAPLDIAPGDAHLVPTGIAIHIENPSLAPVILPRSGLSHKRETVLGSLAHQRNA